MTRAQHALSARRRERIGNWTFCGVILAFELLGVFLARHFTWEDDPDDNMLRILVVGEDDTQRQAYRSAFEHDGYAVLEARDVREASAYIDQDPPDAVILDINLLGGDGRHVLAAIHDLSRALPVIIDTAFSEYHDRFVDLAEAHIAQSASLEELKRAVNDLLVLKRAPQVVRSEEPDDRQTVG